MTVRIRKLTVFKDCLIDKIELCYDSGTGTDRGHIGSVTAELTVEQKTTIKEALVNAQINLHPSDTVTDNIKVCKFEEFYEDGGTTPYHISAAACNFSNEEHVRINKKISDLTSYEKGVIKKALYTLEQEF